MGCGNVRGKVRAGEGSSLRAWRLFLFLPEPDVLRERADEGGIGNSGRSLTHIETDGGRG